MNNFKYHMKLYTIYRVIYTGIFAATYATLAIEPTGTVGLCDHMPGHLKETL